MANLGTWASGTNLTSEWLRCDSAGANCTLTHDTDGSYALTSSDVGSRIILRVTGTDPTPVIGGYRESDSAPTAVVTAAPENTAAP